MTAWLGISELTVRVPSAPPRMMMMIPWKSRNPASVTMNEGILRRAARVPWIAPMNPQQSSDDEDRQPTTARRDPDPAAPA